MSKLVKPQTEAQKKQIRVLNMGAGVQTAYLLFHHWDRYDYVVFSDTGDELEETYEYIENYLKPFCESKGLKWVTVQSKRVPNTLMEYSVKRNIFPIPSKRWCTEEFKIIPIRRFLRTLGATYKNPIISDIGISLDESQRMKFEQSVKYQKVEYPLIDMKITRKMCKEGIIAMGFPLPIKSGCKHCMMRPRKYFRELAQTDRDYFNKIMHMEENADSFPKYVLKGKYPLRMIVENATMDAYFEEQDDDGTENLCDSGHCFV